MKRVMCPYNPEAFPEVFTIWMNNVRGRGVPPTLHTILLSVYICQSIKWNGGEDLLPDVIKEQRISPQAKKSLS